MKLPSHLYADDLVLWGVSKENLRLKLGRFPDLYKRRALKVKKRKIRVRG